MDLWDPVARGIPARTTLEVLEMKPSPYLAYSKDREKPEMVRITEQFEFSASHRLHCPQLTDEDNSRLFGKCNNPRGHGHNYVVEITVEGAVDETGRVIALSALEEIVNRRLINRFDHKYLNEDTEEFRSMNPSVEDIARVAWDLLNDSIESAQLANVRVYDTQNMGGLFRWIT